MGSLLSIPDSPAPSPVAMPSPRLGFSDPEPPRAPPAAAAAAAEEEEEEKQPPWPPRMKMKLAPYAFHCVFSGMGRKGDIVGGAYLGLIVVGYVVKFLSLSPDADRARFWGSVCSVVMALFCVATAAIIGIFIRDYMNVDGVYVVEYDPPQPAAPAAAEQIPPPPPEMDIC